VREIEATAPWAAAKKPPRPGKRDNTLHILIVNGGTDTFLWMDHCLAAIKRFTRIEHEVHVFDYNNRKFFDCDVCRPDAEFTKFRRAHFTGRTDYVSYQHQAALSYLASKLRGGWMVTLDSDSIVLKPKWHQILLEKAGDRNIVALSRRLGRDVHPGASKIAHPSCLCTSVSTYRSLGVDFFGYPRQGRFDSAPAGVYNDTACRLTRRAERRKVKIQLLKRANDFPGLKDLKGSGPALFGTYGDCVYHHGCGSRNFNKRWPSWVRELSDVILGKLMSDFDEFVRFIKAGKR